jgi:hypothetical protein
MRLYRPDLSDRWLWTWILEHMRHALLLLGQTTLERINPLWGAAAYVRKKSFGRIIVTLPFFGQVFAPKIRAHAIAIDTSGHVRLDTMAQFDIGRPPLVREKVIRRGAMSVWEDAHNDRALG